MSVQQRKPLSFMREIEQGCEALGLDLTDMQLTHLQLYLEQLSKWGKVFNLTAVMDPRQMVTIHLMDCLALVASLRNSGLFTAQRPYRILDVGSGAGLPALVLAITANEEFALHVFSVDPVEKKIAFQRQQQALLRLPNFTAFHAQVEQLQCVPAEQSVHYGVGEPMDLITCRAFASLADFTTASMHLLSPDIAKNREIIPSFVAMKAKLEPAETNALPHPIAVSHIEHLQVPGLDAQRCLVWMSVKPHVEPLQIAAS